MKSIPFFKSNGLYVAASFSSANSFFFENEKECEILYSNIRKYLRGMIDVIEIRCFPGGWILVFQSKTSNQIKKTYKRHCQNKEKPRFTDVEHILSEQFRIANSMTVRACNQQGLRSGSRIHSKLIKMIFEDKTDYDKFITKLTKIKIFSNQSLEQFYPEFGRIVMECGMIYKGRDKNYNRIVEDYDHKKIKEFYYKMTQEGIQKSVSTNFK